jgi:DNA modification methylase
MDPDEGLPSLTEKSWDLCLTDPPYNVNAKPHSQAKHKLTHDIGYNDNIVNWDEFNYNWFNNIIRIVKGLIFTPGNINLKWWFEHTNPRDILIHYKKNGAGYTSMVMQNRFDSLLVFGQFNRRFMNNVYECSLDNGFLRLPMDLIHPHPKSIKLWFEIIKDALPTSVIDPFLGSGTTAEVCESLGIPWLGYEIMEEYAVDIDKRITQGQTKYAEIHFKPPTTQKTMDCFGRES